MKKNFTLIICSLWIANLLQAQLNVYPALPGDRSKSETYSVQVREANSNGDALGEFRSSYTYQYLRTEGSSVHNSSILSDNHWTTFSFGDSADVRQVQIEVSKLSGNISSVEFRPTTSVIEHTINNGKLMLTMQSDNMVTVIMNDDIKQPLFLFCDPKEENVPDKNSDDVYPVSGTSMEDPLRISDIPAGKTILYFEPGIHYMYDVNDPISQNGGGLVITDNNGNRMNGNNVNQIYIAGGAYVIGTIRAPKVNDLMVNGRGIIVGETEGIPYCKQGNNYLTDRIYNSAIVMADYNSKTDRNQLVDGITVVLPLKY
ncbi:MAG: hypothetical protein MI922_19410, partial [Bacteroidales bacterium]|nr:hypothetical protein [Bacteroidales bacterium]